MLQNKAPTDKAKPPAATGGAHTKDRMRFLSLSAFNDTKLSSNLQHPQTDWRSMLKKAIEEKAWWVTVIRVARLRLAQERGKHDE